MEPTRRKAGGRRGTWALLVVMLIAGFGLRAWYGSWKLHQSRFWDEQYALKNVRAFFLTGEVKLANVYYPSPVWSVPLATVLKVSDALHSRTGNPAFRVLDGKKWTPTAILLCRWMQAIYGTLAILFVFLAGRRMFSTRIALWAAAMVAFAPWPIHSSGVIKPDGLLLMTIALSFWASVAAVDRPTVWRHVLAGVAIALAISSKLTGAIIAVPLVVAVLVLGWQERRRFVLLAVAGATSVAVFVALNPYWMHYLYFLEGLKEDYAMRAGFTGMTRLSIPPKVIGLLAGESAHGLLLGSVSLVGFGLLAISALRREPGWSAAEEEVAGGAASEQSARVLRAKRAMFIVFPLLYTLVYTVQTPYFKPNNFQPLLLFSALSAAWLLIRAWRAATARWPLLSRPAAAASTIALLTLWLVIPGWLFTYRSLTPTTRDMALRHLNRVLREPASARLAYLEAWDAPYPPWAGAKGRKKLLHRGSSAIRQSASLESFTAAELDAGDGLVFLEHHLEGDAAAFYQQRQASGNTPRVKVYRAEAFKVRGPSMVVVSHRWARQEPYRDLDHHPCDGVAEDFAGGCRMVDLPADQSDDEMVSLFALLSWDSLATVVDEVPQFTVGERRLDLFPASQQRDGWLYVSPRFRVGSEPQRVRLTRNTAFGQGSMRIQLARWAAEPKGE